MTSALSSALNLPTLLSCDFVKINLLADIVKVQGPNTSISDICARIKKWVNDETLFHGSILFLLFGYCFGEYQYLPSHVWQVYVTDIIYGSGVVCYE